LLPAEVIMLDPVSYREAQGVGLYRHFLDNSRWAHFMALGHQAARAALAEPVGSRAAS
jgi:hypothetical protein